MPEHRAESPFIGPTPFHTTSPEPIAAPARPSLRRRILSHLLVPSVFLAAFSARKADALEINVNAASVEDLRSLQGLGPQLAQRIVRERARGPYRDLEDLRARVRGLGERTVRKLVRHGLRVRPVPSAPRLSDNPASPGASPPVLVRP
jgi:hypothetical protein